MANTSIKSAFERMWGHTTNALANKANSADLGDLATKDTIEKTDLASDIQVSLGKADTAVQTLAGYATEDYVSTAISQIPTPDVSGQISAHNTATNAHNDIRLLVEGLTERLNALANSDDTTLDQMAEVVAYIKSNRGLIEGITTSKVNVADIIDNLTTNVDNKPLSAAQGVALKALIDAMQTEVDKKALASDLTSHTSNKDNPHGVTLEQLGVTATAAELNYVDGVTSSIQTQLDNRAKLQSPNNMLHNGNEFTFIPDGYTGEIYINHKTASGKSNGSVSNYHFSNGSGQQATVIANYFKGKFQGDTARLSYNNAEVAMLSDVRALDFSLELYNGTSGNPKPVKFMTVDYSTCGSENGVAIKVGMVSGHGNGTSYAFLQDAIIKVSHTGTVEVDNFKYYGAATTLDGAARQYGDIFWTIDSTNKIVDFYCLMGQYARLQMVPYKRVTYSTGGTITQYTSCTVYSSGDKVWANNSEFALMSDLEAAIAAIPTPDVSGQINTHNTSSSAHSDIRNSVSDHETRLSALEANVITIYSGMEAPLNSVGEDGDIYLYTGE